MTKLFVLCALLLFTVFPFPSAAADYPPLDGGPFVIFHVNLIPMDSNQVLTDRFVLIEHGKISRISAVEIPLPKSAKAIDGTGKFLIPALADLHVHLFSPDDFPAYLTYGVANVLNMDGGPSHLAWRDEIRRGKLLGPSIYTAGHTVDGFPPLNPNFLTAETPEQGSAIVKEQKRAGYDAVKLYGTLRPDVFRAILHTAQQENIPVVGHINRQVGALAVLQSSQSLAAHLEDLLFARFDQPPTDSDLVAFADAIAASHITVTPNLNVNPANIAQLENLNAVLQSPDASLLSASAYSQWMPANNRNERGDQVAQQIEQMKQTQQILYKLVKLLSVRHTPLVLGTDASSYGFPGLSVHQELQELVEAGVSPYEALRTATYNAGQFVARNFSGVSQFGVVQEGAYADLLLLAANPLEDIRNTRNISGLLLRGRWFGREDIARLREKSVEQTAARKSKVEKLDAALDAGDLAAAKQTMPTDVSSENPFYSEWVLMTKARKLQQRNLPAAIEVARIDASLYPDSFSSWYLLADLLFTGRNFKQSSTELQKSLALEPSCAAAINLAAKLQARSQPLKFSPAGIYALEYGKDGQDSVKVSLRIETTGEGKWGGTISGLGKEPIKTTEILAGANRLWIYADTEMGPLEFRISVNGTVVSGYWDGLFGNNGHLTGSRVN